MNRFRVTFAKFFIDYFCERSRYIAILRLEYSKNTAERVNLVQAKVVVLKAKSL